MVKMSSLGFMARVGTAVGLAALMPGTAEGLVQSPVEIPTFSGSASADGVRLTLTVPEGPATDTPIDGGGPTAQVAVDSIGSSTGYASFPDPGVLVITGPGLVVGVVAGGVAGLPPVNLPSPPDYPFFVRSDATAAPEQSAGSGPYVLSASSDPSSSEASAKVGFQTDLFGNAALGHSTASLIPSDGGEVVAKAVSTLEAFSIGPLSLGEVKSTAELTLHPDGTLTPSARLEIRGLRIGGVSVSVTPQGLIAGKETVPLAINDTLKDMLKGANITVEVVNGQEFPGRVVAPALRIAMPFDMPVAIPNVGQFSGTGTLTIGFATASMTGAAAPGAVAGDEALLPGEQSGASTPEHQLAASTPGISLSDPDAANSEGPLNADGNLPGGGAPAELNLSRGDESIAAGSAVAPGWAPSSTGNRSVHPDQGQPAALIAAADTDIGSLYLVVAVGALIAVARWLGVRRPWTSTAG